MGGTLGNRDQQREFYLAYGTAMGCWAEVEYEMGNTFIAMTKMPEALGRAVFFSARSFLGRADMFAECIPFVRDIPTAKRFLLDARNLAASWQGVRNTLAHEMHGFIFQPGRGPYYAVSPQRGAQIETPQLRAAAENFFVLAQLIRFSRGEKRLVREPELCAEALALLPADALQDAQAQTHAARLLTRIQASDD